MKIGIVTTAFQPPRYGVAKVIAETISCMSQRFKLNFVVFYPKPRVSEQTVANEKIETREFSRFIKLPRYTIYSGMLSSLLKEKLDIIHAHDYGYYPALCGFWASKIKNLPFVLTPHIHPPIFTRWRAFLFHLHKYGQGFFTLRYASVVIALTQHEKHILSNICGSDKNIVVIPNPVDCKKFRKKKVSKPPELKEKIVLFVGRMLPNWKGPEILFKISRNIIKKRRDVSFVFIGSGPLKSVLEKIAKKESKGTYLFREKVSEKELIKWYNLANIFALPSYYEAFGMVLAEAQACCTPCVSTLVGGIPEVVINGKTGLLVEYGDWKRFEENIEYLLDNPKLAKQMGKAGRRHVEKNFEITKVSQKLYRVYESLVE